MDIPQTKVGCLAGAAHAEPTKAIKLAMGFLRSKFVGGLAVIVTEYLKSAEFKAGMKQNPFLMFVSLPLQLSVIILDRSLKASQK